MKKSLNRPNVPYVAHLVSRLGLLFALVLLPVLLSVYTYTRIPAPVYAATSSETLNYQGRLLSSTGALVPDGYYNIQFNLYSVSSGGSSNWTETLDYNGGSPDNRVRVVNGYFSAVLGNLDSLADESDVDWQNDVWLGLTVRGATQCAFAGCTPADAEMAPRTKLTGVPYALVSGNVKSANTTAASTNSATVTIQSGNTAGVTSNTGNITLTTGNATSGNSGNVTLDVGTASGTAGSISIGTANASSITLGRVGILSTLQGNLRFSALNCTGNTNGGALTADADGDVSCSDDDGGGSSTTLQNAYDNDADGSDAIIALTSADGGVLIRDNATPLASTLFAVQNSTGATSYLSVDTSGIGVNGSIKLTGSGAFPGSPTEGQIYYRTDTDQLYVYTGSKWQADRTTATYIVAASDSINKEKADYVATGTNDQDTINAAINALPASPRGIVYLLEGTYNIDDGADNDDEGVEVDKGGTVLAGAGPSTYLKNVNSINTNFETVSSNAVSNVTIRDLQIDGNRTNQSAGTQYGIDITGLGSGAGTTAVPGVIIQNVQIKDVRSTGIRLTSTTLNSLVTGVRVVNSGTYGLEIGTSSVRNIVTDSHFQGNGDVGVRVSSSDNSITNNTVESNTNQGIYTLSDRTLIAGNILRGNGSGINDSAILVNGAVGAQVTGNNVSTGYVGIEIYSADSTTVTGNTVSSTSNIGIFARVGSSRTNISGNSVYAAGTDGISINTSDYSNVSGNLVDSSVANGIHLDSNVDYASVTGNFVYNSAGAGSSDGIFVNNSTTNNQITSNKITDTAGTGCAIDFATGTPATNTYLADNTYSGTGAASICNIPATTIQAGQISSTNTFVIQGTAGVTLGEDLAVNGGDITSSGALNITPGGALTLGATGQAATLQGTITTITSNGAGNDIILNSADQILLQDPTTITGQLTVDDGNAATGALLVVDSSSVAPTGIDGGIYYDTGLNKFRCYQNGAFTDCIGAGGSTTLQTAYDNDVDGSDAIIALTSADGGVLIRDNATPIASTLFAVQSSAAANYFSVSATAVNLGVDTTVAAGNSLIITGSGAFPGTPTEGQVYYRTDTDQLYIYTGSKWQADRTTATKIVSNSITSGDSIASQNPDAADYVNNSATSAQTVINSAIAALPATGGTIYLMEGTYVVDGQVNLISNLTIVGAGPGTILQIKDATNADLNIFGTDSASDKLHVKLTNLRLNGNKAANSAGVQNGIELDEVGDGDDSGAYIDHVIIDNFRTNGITDDGTGTYRNVITNSSIHDNTGDGIRFGNSTLGTSMTTIANNNFTDNGSDAIHIDGSSQNTISGNTIDNSTADGIYLASTSTKNTVSGNTIDNPGSHGIELDLSTNENTITGNTINSAGANGIATAQSSSDNIISNNVITSSAAVGISVYGSGQIIDGNRIINSGTNSISLTGGVGGSNHSITNNRISDSGGTGYAIVINSNYTNTYLAGNTITGTYNTAGSISDASTTTIYAGQLNSNNDFVLQGATRTLSQQDLEVMGAINGVSGGIGQYGNLLIYSEQFDNAAWTKTSVTATADTAAAPDGATTADTLDATAVTGTTSQTSSTASGSTYTFSIWLRSITGTRNISLRIDGATTGTGTAKVLAVGTTWQRYYVTQDTAAFTGNVVPKIISTAATDDVYAWGAQLNTSSLPLAYVETAASTVTAGVGVVSNGSLHVVDSGTFGGDLAVNGGDITSSGALNVTPGGALTLGVTGQTALLQGTVTTITSNGAGNDIILTTADKIILTGFDCTGNTNGGALTASATGELSCSDDDGGAGGGTLQSAYDADADGSDAIIDLTTADGGVMIRDNATPIASTLFAVQSSAAANYLSVSATAVNLGVSTVLAANQSLTVTGGATGSRPGSPTEGMFYYDQTLDQMLVYANGKWQADRTTATKIVAASDSQNKEKADYVADGTKDQVQINQAIAALPATGGIVYLLDGTYNVEDLDDGAGDSDNRAVEIDKSNVTLAGSGSNTIIKATDNSDIYDLIADSSVGTISRLAIRDLRVDGNKAAAGTQIQVGIYLTGVGSGTATSAVPGVKIDNVWVENSEDAGIYFSAVNNSSVTNSTVQNGDDAGFLFSTSNYNSFSGNTVQGNSNMGFRFNGTNTNNVVTNNVIEGNGQAGVNAQGSSTYGVISDNLIRNTTTSGYGVWLEATADSWVVSGNNIVSSSNDAVALNASYTKVMGNNIDTTTSDTGVIVTSGALHTTIAGNTIRGVAGVGIDIDDADFTIVSGNKLINIGAVTVSASSIQVGSGGTSASNQIIGNIITDNAGTGYAVRIYANASTTYVADNTYSGTGATSIDDASTTTIYAGQLNSNNDFVLQGATRTLSQQDLEVMGVINGVSGGIGQYGNLLTYSEQFDNAAWTKTSVTATANSVAAPDGLTTAETLDATGATGTTSQTSGTASGSTYTFSVWLRSITGTRNISLRIDGATTGTGTAKTLAVGTTWQRYYVTQNTTTFTGNVVPKIIATATTDDVYAWGGQLLAGSSSGVYAETIASTVTSDVGIISNGSLRVVDSGTFGGDLAVNGGDITSSGALNVTPGGALTLGATGQTALLQGTVTTITSNGAGNDIILTSADKIILTGFNCTGNTNGGALTASATGELSCSDDDGGGSSSTLQDAYNASTTPATILLSAADDNLLFQNPASGGLDVAGAPVLKIENLATGNVEGLRVESAGTGNLFTVRDTTATATDTFKIADGGAITAQNQTNSTSAFAIKNAAGSSLLNLSTSTGARLEVVGDIVSKGTEWTSRTNSAANQWRAITYGNGLFVAISTDGTGNRVMTSPDGINWTSRTSAADNSWRSVTYGNGLFVAVSTSGTGNRVMTSPDGITWTSRTSAVDNAWTGVAYGNGLFAAVSNTGTGDRVMTSPDGITWTTRTSAADNQWHGLAYGNGLFVAVSISGTGNRVMTSPDGITWTTRTSVSDTNWQSVTYGNGLFVAVSSAGGTNRVMTSPDGVTWTLQTTPDGNGWFSVTYGNGLYVAVAQTGTNRVMTSPDGVTWTSRASAADNLWQGVAYGNGLFAAVSLDGTSNRVMTSGKADYIASQNNNIYQGGITVRSGSALFNSGVGSTTAFQIQNASAQSLLTADTSNRRISLDDGQAALANLFVLDSSSAAPTAVAGGMYFDTGTSKFKCSENGSTFVDCISAGGGTLQSAYDASTTPATILLSAADDNLLFQNPASGGLDVAGAPVLKIENLATGNVEGLRVESAGTGNLFTVRDTTATATDAFKIADGGATTLQNQTNSAGAFVVKNAAGSDVVAVDTSTPRIVIGGDTTLYRAAANFLETGGSFKALGSGELGSGDTNPSLTISDTGSRALSLAIATSAGSYSDIASVGDAVLRAETASLILSARNASGGIYFSVGATDVAVQTLSSTGAATFKNTSNSTAAFQVQKTDGNEIMTADTSGSQIVFGKASTLGGKLVVHGSTSGNITITTAAAVTSYSLVLPGTAGASGDCLKNSGTAGTLTFGSCGAGGGGTRKITLAPEYAGGIIKADGSDNSGTMTSDYDSTDRHTYYEWTSTVGTLNDYNVIVQNQIPSDYASGFGTFKIWAYADSTSTANNDIQVTVRDGSGTACASSVSVLPGSATTWTEQTVTLTGCTFAASDIITVDVKVFSKSSNKVRIGRISYQYTN